jgi:hypothetical protein
MVGYHSVPVSCSWNEHDMLTGTTWTLFIRPANETTNLSPWEMQRDENEDLVEVETIPEEGTYTPVELSHVCLATRIGGKLLIQDFIRHLVLFSIVYRTQQDQRSDSPFE